MKKIINIILSVVFGFAMFTVDIDVRNDVAQNAETISVSFENVAHAKSRFEKKVEKAVDRIEGNTINRSVNRTQRRIQNRINDHMDSVIDLLDPSSKAYKKWSMKKLFNNLPYGESTVLVQGSKASTLQRIVKESTNGAIVANVYKKGANGKRGPKVGFVILKTENVNDILVYE